MPQKFDDVQHGISDIPGGYIGGLSWDELKMVAWRRYEAAGKPQDKLTAWLDDHQVYPKREDPEYRVLQLDWFQMLGLMRETAFWEHEARVEANPPFADGENET